MSNPWHHSFGADPAVPSEARPIANQNEPARPGGPGGAPEWHCRAPAPEEVPAVLRHRELSGPIDFPWRTIDQTGAAQRIAKLDSLTLADRLLRASSHPDCSHPLVVVALLDRARSELCGTPFPPTDDVETALAIADSLAGPEETAALRLSLLAESLTILAEHCLARSRNLRAFHLLTQAEALLHGAGEGFGAAQIELDAAQAVAAALRGEPDIAYERLRAARAAAHRAGDALLEAQILTTEAQILELAGDSARAATTRARSEQILGGGVPTPHWLAVLRAGKTFDFVPDDPPLDLPDGESAQDADPGESWMALELTLEPGAH